jgi:hypothetical protein
VEILIRKFKIKNLKFKIAIAAFFLSASAFADLEWITGGVPKNTVDKSTSTVVKDAPGDEGRVAAVGSQDIIVSHLTTATKIVNQYPVDSVNFFYLTKNPQVSYFSYFLIKPSSRIHTALVEWYSPSGLRIAKFEKEFKVGFTDQLLTIKNETYQWFMVNMTIGVDHMNPEFGQSGLPKDLGLYTIHLTVDGQMVGLTFFYMKAPEARAPAPVATIPAASKGGGSSLPMSPPVSNQPIPKNIK